MGKLKYSQPLIIDEVAVDFPKVKFVIAHCGTPWVADAVEVVAKNKNVYMDLSGLMEGKFKAKKQSMIALECLPLNDASNERKGTVSFVFNISLLSSINLEASSKVLFISILFFFR